MILGIVLPVVNVDVGKTGDEQFQFLFVEDGDQLRRHNIVEAYLLSAVRQGLSQ